MPRDFFPITNDADVTLEMEVAPTYINVNLPPSTSFIDMFSLTRIKIHGLVKTVAVFFFLYFKTRASLILRKSVNNPT